MKFGFVSLGCAKNLVDSQELMGRLKAIGHTITENYREAEAIVINTCGFIQSAKEEAINTILEMAEYKQGNLKYLIVTGCLSQRYKKDLEEMMPEVDRFVAIDEYGDFENIIDNVLHESRFTSQKSERVLTGKPWMAYLKIAEGCSNCCTYCAIPLIRGPFRSIPMEEVLKNAKYLEEKGVKELVVIAQDTSRYGSDWDGKTHLLDLLIELNKMNFHWIRVLYMYPDEIDEPLIAGMSTLDKVVPYFDIPMQHGSDHMLKRMNRRGTKKSVEDLTKLIRKYNKQCTLRTTIIVGFPGETEKDFDLLLDFVKEAKWDRLGAFTYSKEEDTPAYNFSRQVSKKKKQERYDRLMSIQQEISQKNSEQLIGQTVEVVVEGYDTLKDIYHTRSRLSAPDDVDGTVYVKSNKVLNRGEFYEVVIDSANIYDLYGHID